MVKKKGKRETRELRESRETRAPPKLRLPAGVSPTAVLFAVVIASLAGYIILKSVVLGVLAFVAMIALVALDVIPKSREKESLIATATEVAVALIAAVAAWFALGYLLNTPSPLNVVTSCSMSPALERGDLVLLQGGAVNAREVNFSRELPAMKIVKKKCVLVGANAAKEALCSSSLVVGNEAIALDEAERDSDTIVFLPKQPGYDLVIHRAILRLRNAATGEVFYLTKGDNNIAFDQEVSIGFVSEKKVLGKVVARVPYVGYVKLILFMQFAEPEGCGWRVETKA